MYISLNLAALTCDYSTPYIGELKYPPISATSRPTMAPPILHIAIYVFFGVSFLEISSQVIYIVLDSLRLAC